MLWLCVLLQASAGPPRAGVLLGPGPHSSVNVIRYPNLINDHFNFQIQSQQHYTVYLNIKEFSGLCCQLIYCVSIYMFEIMYNIC